MSARSADCDADDNCGLFGSDGDPLKSWAFDGTAASTSRWLNLGVGSYCFDVRRPASGMIAGGYTLASTVATVSDPEAWALMLVGFGPLASAPRWAQEAGPAVASKSTETI